MTTISPASVTTNLLLSLGLGGNASSAQGLLTAGKPGFAPVIRGEIPAGQSVNGANIALPQAFRLLPNGEIEQIESVPVTPALKRQSRQLAPEGAPHLINVTFLPDGLTLAPDTAISTQTVTSVSNNETAPILPETGFGKPADEAEVITAIIGEPNSATQAGVAPPITSGQNVLPVIAPQQLSAALPVPTAESEVVGPKIAAAPAITTDPEAVGPKITAAPAITTEPEVVGPKITAAPVPTAQPKAASLKIAATPNADAQPVQTNPETIPAGVGKTTSAAIPAKQIPVVISTPAPEAIQGLTLPIKNSTERKNAPTVTAAIAGKTTKSNGTATASQGQSGQTAAATPQATSNHPVSTPAANSSGQSSEPGQSVPAGQSIATPVISGDGTLLPPEGQLNSIQQTSSHALTTYGRNAPPPSPIAHQIGLQITKAVTAGRSEFTIRIDPPELGRVEVRLDFGTEGRMKAHLVAENKEALELLQRDHRVLERALTDAGVKTDSASLNFSLKQQGGQASAQQGSNGQNETGNATNKDSQETLALTGDDLDEQIAATLLSDRVLDIRI